MTAAGTNPGQDASPGTISSGDPGTSASGAADGSANAASGSQDSGSGDYLDRVRSGGDFAAQEVRSHQSRADKAEARLNAMEWIGTLEQGRGSLSGDEIMHHLGQYNGLLQDPGMKAAIERFRSNGSSPDTSTTSTDADEEYLSDEQRELRQVRTELADLKTRQGQTEFLDGQQALKQHMEDIRGAYGLPDDVFKTGSEATAAQIVQWHSQGETGRKAIESLKGPNGRKVVEGILIPAIGPEGLLQAQQNRDRRRTNALGALETDGPSGNASTGREEAPKFTGPNAHLDAARWAAENPGAHDAR